MTHSNFVHVISGSKPWFQRKLKIYDGIIIIIIIIKDRRRLSMNNGPAIHLKTFHSCFLNKLLVTVATLVSAECRRRNYIILYQYTSVPAYVL